LQSWASRCGSFQEAAGDRQAQGTWERVQQAPKLGLQHQGGTGHRGQAGEGGEYMAAAGMAGGYCPNKGLATQAEGALST
jgi:hypothetical protein